MTDWSQAVPDAEGRLQRFRAALLVLSQSYAARIEGDMKRDRPWHDRTANARNRLFGRAEVFDANPATYAVGVRAGHGMEYGVWLENPTRFRRRGPGPNGSYPIVGPTVEAAAPRFFADARQLWGRTGL